MDINKKKLFEAFEKVCGIKLLKENEYDEVSEIKNYLLNNLTINTDLNDGLNVVEDYEFEFNLNGKDYTTLLDLTINTTEYNESEGEYEPGYSTFEIDDVDIYSLTVSDENGNIFIYNDKNKDEKEFIIKLENTINVNYLF